MAATFATCSYGEFRLEMGYPVRTTVGAPRRFAFPTPHLEAVTPRPWMLRMKYPEFKEAYLSLLNRTGIDTVVQAAQAIADNVGESDSRLVFLCFEHLGNGRKFCHRSFLRTWLENEHGIRCPELGAVPPPPPEQAQSSLW
ncbi:hypothetical protein [Streptomyces sp. TR02-1]|uniref:hypothetical protein n=1 Tax=Streptomyces sp. TR02-1 TaxID=3385977 RepID=UPI0039A2BAC4